MGGVIGDIMDDWFGVDPAQPPSYNVPDTPLSQQVNWKETGYTSHDGGNTYTEDANKHFSYEGGDFYVTPGADVNDRNSWQSDTMYNYHRSPAEQELALWREREMSAMTEHNNSVLDQMRQQNELMLAQLQAEAKRLAEEKAEYEEKLRLEEESRQKKLALAAKGRSGTLLTGGRGVEEESTGRRKTLGAA